MKKLVVWLALGMLPIAGQASLGGLMDGFSLLGACKSEITAQHASCLGYLVGVAEATVDSRDSFPGVASNVYISFGDVCIPPEGVMQNELESAFVDYSTEHPELLESPAANLVLSAYASIWPCQYTQPAESSDVAQIET